MQTELGGFLDDYREIGFLAVELPLIGSFDKGIIYTSAKVDDIFRYVVVPVNYKFGIITLSTVKVAEIKIVLTIPVL